MNDMMGLIYTGEMDERLRELTAMRAVAAVPMLARYRLIDFPLSSMVDSGIRNIGVIMQRNYHSLLDHLGSGKEWDLHGKRSGLVILPPFLTRDNVGLYEGFLDAIRSNLSFLRRSKETYVVLSNSHILYSARFEDMVSFHEKMGADITVMYTKDRGARRNGSGKYAQVAEDGGITQIEVDPIIPRFDATMTEVFLLKRELLIMLCDRATSRGQYHFTRQLLMNAVNDRSLAVYGFECPGRVWPIDSVQAYYQCNMDLLKADNRASIFPEDRPVWTKLRDEMPTRYLPGAHVQNSFIADGCILEGTVENSVLFRSVRVEKDAVVRNSIIMQDGRIGSLSELDHCILDKQVTIRENTRLIGPMNYPVVIAKNLTV